MIANESFETASFEKIAELITNQLNVPAEVHNSGGGVDVIYVGKEQNILVSEYDEHHLEVSISPDGDETTVVDNFEDMLTAIRNQI